MHKRFYRIIFSAFYLQLPSPCWITDDFQEIQGCPLFGVRQGFQLKRHAFVTAAPGAAQVDRHRLKTFD